VASRAPVLAVGHEPTMSALATALLGGRAVPAFRKTEACWIVDGAIRAWLGGERAGA
jgi:phosphohistidine phosphatase SixA